MSQIITAPPGAEAHPWRWSPPRTTWLGRLFDHVMGLLGIG